MKFNLTEFIMKTLLDMWVGGEKEYKIRQYALKRYNRGILSEEDIMIVDSWFMEPVKNISEEDKNNEK